MNHSSHRLGVGLIGGGLALVVVGLVLVLGGGGDGAADPAPTASTSSDLVVAVASTTTIAPTTTASPTTTAAPTTTTAAPTTTTIDPEALVEPFFDELSAALRSGDEEFLFSGLHPLVFERYAEADCRAYLAGLVVPAYVVRATAVGPPETWAWETDGVVRLVPEALPVATRTAPDGSNFTTGEAHVVLVDGSVRWFTDCGTPKEGAR